MLLTLIPSFIAFLICFVLLTHGARQKRRPNYEIINRLSRELGYEPLTENWKGEPLEDKSRSPMPDFLSRKTEEQYMQLMIEEEAKKNKEPPRQIRDITGRVYDPFDLDNIIDDQYKTDGM